MVPLMYPLTADAFFSSPIPFPTYPPSFLPGKAEQKSDARPTFSTSMASSTR